MDRLSNLAATETLCREIMNSVYFRKQTPEELKELRIVLNKVSLLVGENVPQLITEVKRLRNQVKRLDAEVAAMGSSEESRQVPLSA